MVMAAMKLTGARTLEVGKRWARLARARAASRPGLCATAPGRRAGAPPLWQLEIGRASCRERVETVSDFIFGAPKSLQMVMAAM